MKTKLYLDVDGVLNPWAAKNPHKHWLDYKKYPLKPGGEVFKLWLSKELAAELVSLPVEIVWATTWCEYANKLISPVLNWPEFRYLDYLPDHDTLTSCGKLKVVQEDALEGEPIIWIDDCLDVDDFAWAKDRTGPSKLIKPHPAVGVTKYHIADILTFLKGNS